MLPISIISNQSLILFSFSFLIFSGTETEETYFGKEDHGAKTRRELPDEAGVFGEPFDVALVAAVEKDRALALRAHPVLGVDEVPLLEFRGIGEAKVVEVLREISGFVLESLLR